MPSASHTQFQLKINKSKGPNMQRITSEEAQTPAIAPICTTKLQQSKNNKQLSRIKLKGSKMRKNQKTGRDGKKIKQTEATIL